MRYKIIYLITVIVSLQACMPSETYIKTYVISPKGWDYKDAKQFNFNIADTSKKYDLSFLIQHDYDYLYSNILIQLITQYPNGSKDSTQPLEIPLSPPNGQWLANTAANKATHEINIGPGGAPLQFKETGNYTITMIQMMRDSVLKSVNKVGLSLSVHHATKLP
jgi:gliding motility-associated lipoprotein GldH